MIPQDLQNGAGESRFTLYRLIGVGIGSHGNHITAIARFMQFISQQGRRVWLVEYPGLKIQTRRHIEEGMGRAGKTIGTAMLAPLVGVDRPVERYIR